MSNLVLLTGATGYVGGRLLKLLAESGRSVRCFARRPEALSDRVPKGVEIVKGDILNPDSLLAAMKDVESAYYLIHSMGSSGDFADEDRRAAQYFASAAKAAGVRRIIYLGGLGEAEPGLSPHLRSRQEVGEVLRASGIPVVELRASVIIGSGSLSFEMVRALVERLPVLVSPRWVRVLAQPIFIGDVLSYLIQALDLSLTQSQIFEIGGQDIVSYEEIMREYARQRGLRRWWIRVPILTPKLSSLWLGLVTPLYARVGRKLIDSIRHPTVVRDPAASLAFSIRPMGVSEAIARALRNEDSEIAQSRWSDALSSSGEVRQWGGARFGNRLADSRTISITVSQEVAFRAVERIGGATGWYYANWLWTVRGWVDLLFGGIGMRRGRRDPRHLAVGDVVDCWRVESIERGTRLLLAAEMKLPGRAWLEFDVTKSPDGVGSVLRQTAVFDPLGLSGLAYWYGIWPLHQFVFSGMPRGLARAARASSATVIGS